MASKVRVRFAPSPTGYLHIGNLRSALFNWLFARHHKGVFILRIEDTDLARSTPEAVQAILDGMQWLGLEHDEGPFYQTQRMDRYGEVIQQFLREGTAYHCYCSKEELDEMRAAQMAVGRVTMQATQTSEAALQISVLLIQHHLIARRRSLAACAASVEG